MEKATSTNSYSGICQTWRISVGWGDVIGMGEKYGRKVIEFSRLFDESGQKTVNTSTDVVISSLWQQDPCPYSPYSQPLASPTVMYNTDSQSSFIHQTPTFLCTDDVTRARTKEWEKEGDEWIWGGDLVPKTS